VTPSTGRLRGSLLRIRPTRFRVNATPASSGYFWNTAQLLSASTLDPDSQFASGTGDGQDDAASVDIRTGNDTTMHFFASVNPNQTPLPNVIGNQPAPDPDKVDLCLSIVSDQLAPRTNSSITCALIVQNKGGKTANNVSVQVALPAGWQLIGPTANLQFTSVAALNSVTQNVQIKVTNTGLLQGQIVSSNEINANSTLGNGFTNGEKDEASLVIRVR